MGSPGQAIHRIPAAARKSIGFAARALWAAVFLLCAGATVSECRPWFRGGPWPDTSLEPARPLAEAPPDLPGAGPYRFISFGDQRALADGEWQEMLGAIAALAGRDPSIRFMLDTGDIVYDGSHSDQFGFLREILDGGPRLPYLVAVGNHEVRNNRSEEARSHTARALSYLDPALSAERLYYRKDIGPLRFLFLDSNDFVYGGEGDGIARRAQAQESWLVEELALAGGGVPPVTVVAMHHPFLQSSSYHREESRALWSYRIGGRTLPERFAEAGVDLVLAGHTHTYERFRVTRVGEEGFTLINLSGRPRSLLLGMGGGGRKARDLRGAEAESLAEKGWRDLDGWRVVQEDFMPGRGANQFGIFSVGSEGEIAFEACFLDEDAPEGFRRAGEVRVFAPRSVAVER